METTQGHKAVYVRAADHRVATSRATKFALARRLLEGATKTSFENAAHLNGGVTTNVNFQECLKAVTADVLSPNALINQKQFICCFLRKPADMLAKDYIAWVCKINSYLMAFPTKPGRDPTKIPTN